jgi:hypothetical protein
MKKKKKSRNEIEKSSFSSNFYVLTKWSREVKDRTASLSIQDLLWDPFMSYLYPFHNLIPYFNGTHFNINFNTVLPPTCRSQKHSPS